MVKKKRIRIEMKSAKEPLQSLIENSEKLRKHDQKTVKIVFVAIMLLLIFNLTTCGRINHLEGENVKLKQLLIERVLEWH